MKVSRLTCFVALVSGACWVQACGSDSSPGGGAPNAGDAGTNSAPAPTDTPPPTTEPPPVTTDDGGSDAGDVDAADDAGDGASGDAGDAGSFSLDGGTCDGGAGTLSGVAPLFAYTGSDSPLTISGSGFDPAAQVYLVDTSKNAVALKNVAYISPTSLTGTVPSGLGAGTYDIAVVSPGGCATYLAGGFKLVATPVPLVLSVSPAQGTTQADVPVTVTGCYFANDATLSTVSESGTVVVQTSSAPVAGANDARCNGGPLYTISGSIGTQTKMLVEGAYLVRVTNVAQGTYGEYASFVVSNPSGNLVGGWQAGPALKTGRRSLGVGRLHLDDANRFLYAVGGEDGTGVPLGTVEVAQVNRFGKLGGWTVNKNTLKTPRAGHAVVQQGFYLYAIGGTGSTNGTAGAGVTDPSGTPLDTIERAKLLQPSGAPTITQVSPSTASGSLAAGTWYYRVAAVLDGTDPETAGETLASARVTASLAQAGKVDLTWTAPATGSVAHYRVYRTATASAAAGTEVLLADNVATTSFSDTGSFVPTSEKPMPLGSTGPWIELAGKLQHARVNTAATIAPDPNGALHLYVVGGFGKCAGAATAAAMRCYEYATLSSDGTTLGAFTDGTQLLGLGRLRHGADTMTALNGPATFTANAGASTAFVVVAGGKSILTSALTSEYARVTAGGGLTAWANPTGFSSQRDGTQLIIANGYGYAFVGGQAANAYAVSSDQSSQSTVTATTLSFGAWSNAAANLGSKLARHGATAESAYFYLVGGTTNDADALTNVWQVLH